VVRLIAQSCNIVKKRKKVDGILWHSVNSLKKVAQFPRKDHSSVLHILKSKASKLHGSDRLKKAVKVVSSGTFDKSSSSGSVNNDWVNWVAVHGNEKVVMEDVKGIGEAIGVQFYGNNNNMFGVLSRKGRGRKEGRCEGKDGGEGATVEVLVEGVVVRVRVWR